MMTDQTQEEASDESQPDMSAYVPDLSEVAGSIDPGDQPSVFASLIAYHSLEPIALQIREAIASLPQPPAGPILLINEFSVAEAARVEELLGQRVTALQSDVDSLAKAVDEALKRRAGTITRQALGAFVAAGAALAAAAAPQAVRLLETNRTIRSAAFAVNQVALTTVLVKVFQETSGGGAKIEVRVPGLTPIPKGDNTSIVRSAEELVTSTNALVKRLNELDLRVLAKTYGTKAEEWEPEDKQDAVLVSSARSVVESVRKKVAAAYTVPDGTRLPPIELANAYSQHKAKGILFARAVIAGSESNYDERMVRSDRYQHFGGAAVAYAFVQDGKIVASGLVHHVGTSSGKIGEFPTIAVES